MKDSSIFMLFTVLLLLAGCNTNPDAKYTVDPVDASARANGDTDTESLELNNIEPFVSKEGRFSIQFPGLPKKETQSTPTEVGPIKITMFLYKEGATLAYLVGYSDYPKEIIKNADSNEILKSAQQGAVANIEGKIITDESIMLEKKYLGKHFTAKSDKVYVVYEMYLVGDRLYHVAVMSTMGLVDNDPATQKFINSFQLLKTNTEVE